MKVNNMGQPNDLLVDDLELLLREIDEFNTAIGNNKPLDIPQSLDNYLQFVAKSGNTVFPWPHVRTLFRTKMMNAIQQFQEPVCPNESFVLERFDLFRLAAPFTVQRLTELILQPTRHYRKKEKFLRGLEKTVLVVSTVEPHSLTTEEEKNGNDVSNTSGSSGEPETELVQFNRTFSLDRNDMNPITVRPEVTAPTSTDIIDPVAAAVDTISETLPVEGLTDSVSTTDVPSADTLTSATSIPTEAPILDTNASEDLIVSMDSDDGQDVLLSSNEASTIDDSTSNIIIESVTTSAVEPVINIAPSDLASVTTSATVVKTAETTNEPTERIAVDPVNETDVGVSMDAEDAGVLITAVPLSGAPCETASESGIIDPVTTTEVTAKVESVADEKSVQPEESLPEKVTSSEVSSEELAVPEAAVVSSDGIIYEPISDTATVAVESEKGPSQMECESSTPVDIQPADVVESVSVVTINEPPADANLTQVTAVSVPEDVSSSLATMPNVIPAEESENISMDCQPASLSETAENTAADTVQPASEVTENQS